MKLLLLRLSALDADAGNGLRVIGFFDELIARRVPLRVLVRETAKLAECPAGVFDVGQGVSLRAEPDGGVTAGPGPAEGAVTRRLSAESGVWIERAGDPLALDDILTERFAIAAALLLEHAHGPVPDVDDSAPVKLALSANASEAQRSRALRSMDVDPGDRIRVLAVAAGTGPGPNLLAALGLSRIGARCADMGRVHAVVVRAERYDAPNPAPGDVRVGVGPEVAGADARHSWDQARTALRFAAAGGPVVVHSDDLGAMAVIATRLRAADIAQVRDVTALDALAVEPDGADTLAILDALCRTGSARKAAVAVHRHHSTVLARLARAECGLGFPVGDPTGRLRLELALAVRRLRATAGQDTT